MKISAAIKGVYGHVPDNVVTNHDLAKVVDTNDEWITTGQESKKGVTS